MAKVAEEAMRPPGQPVTAPGARLVMSDVYDHPGSAIGEITARTALPQSFVSDVVATLRDKGVFETSPDPADRRRTLVRVRGAIPKLIIEDIGAVLVDDRLLDAFGDLLDGPKLVEMLEVIAARLRVMRQGPGGTSSPL